MNNNKSHWQTMAWSNRVEHVLFNYTTVTKEHEASHMERLFGELCPFVQHEERKARTDAPFAKVV